jgi:hypothetical protein
MRQFGALTVVLFVSAAAPAGDYGDPLPLDKRVAALEKKVAELEARLAAVAPPPVQQPVAPPTWYTQPAGSVDWPTIPMTGPYQTCVGGNCSVQYAQPVRIFRR